MFRLPFLRLLGLAILASTASTAGAVQPAVDEVLLPAAAVVGGQSQAAWSRDWWQWAASFDRGASPVADRTGALCAAGQRGPVWFLAGTYGSARTIRTCTVPAGKALFFPLVNDVVMPPADRPVGCSGVTEQAAEDTEDASRLLLVVDGRRYEHLESHRLATPAGCFDLGARTSPRLRVFPAAGNGYYVMLAPLAPGRHVIEFGGVLPDLVQAVSYTLDVR